MSVLRFALFFLVVSSVLVLVNLYVARFLTQAFSLSRRSRGVLTVVLGGSILGMVAGRIVDRAVAGAPVAGLVAVSSVVQLAVLLTLLPLLAGDLGLFVRRHWQERVRRKSPPSEGEALASAAPPELPRAAEVAATTLALPPALEIPRRTFLGQAAAGSALLIGSSSSLYGALLGRHDYSIEDVPVRIPGLPRSLDGFTIVQLSDVHIGQFVGEPELAAARDLIARARPDLIVLTGDLLDHDARLAGRLGEFARRLGPLARHGVVAISGNHDFWAGIEPTVEALEAGGARVLRNEGIVLGDHGGRFALLGVDDVWAKRFGPGGPDLDRAIRSLPEIEGSRAKAQDLPRVLLCHNPVYFEAAAGKVALQLSGHTHGGQINFGLRPADWVLKNGWVAGRYEQSGSLLYVNRGFGTVGPPARLGAPPEVTRVVLTA